MPDTIVVRVNGRSVEVPAGSTVLAAVAIAGEQACRRSVRGEARAPLCGMGICFECRVTIGGARHQRACQTLCASGMDVRTDG
ncbi:(2Fe-2S)-binding protein [bacterium]|nr:MAG: (2Fe-2S)-binding protein [bacterium]